MELIEKDLEVNPRYPTEDDENITDLPELDLLPEFSQYRDEGCELADSCLECPFPGCMHDSASGKRRLLKIVRDREIVRLFAAGKVSLKELAKRFGVSKRTVQRALAKRNKGAITKKQ